MSTDRTNARALVESWIPVLTGSLQEAMAFGSAYNSMVDFYDTDDILEWLINTPLQAESNEELDEELAVLVAVYKRGGRAAEALRSCGKSALRAKTALHRFTPKVNVEPSYEAVLELVAEMKQLVGVLTVRRGANIGNVTHISAGPQDPQLAAVAELAQTMCHQLAEHMNRVMEAYDYSRVSAVHSKISETVRLLASVPYLARDGGVVPEKLEPLVQVYRRGGKYTKAIDRCSNAAVLAQSGAVDLYKDFPKARIQLHLGMQKLFPALEALRAKVSAAN